MHQRLRPAAVIGEQDQSRCIDIQASDEVEGVPVGFIDQVDHGRVFGVARGTEHPHRLVQHQAETAGGGLDHRVLQSNARETVHFVISIGRDLIIDGNLSLEDTPACLSTAHQLEFCEKAV